MRWRQLLRLAGAAGALALPACTSASTRTAGAPASTVSLSTTGAVSSPSTAAAPTSTAVVPPTSTSPTTTAASPATLAVDPAHPCGLAAAPPDAYDHVIWIWMENKDASAVPSPDAPYLSALGEACGVAADYVDHGVHPSLPNYLLATSGSDQGVHDDAGPAAHPLTADNVFRQVRAAGGTARSYVEAMTEPCQTGSTHRYAVKHNPAVYYVGGDDRAACLRDDVPLEQLTADLASGDLPAFASVTPDICNDMHDCAVGQGDAWLSTVVPAVLTSDAYRAGRTALFVVWDESTGGGTMPFVAVAPSIAPGTVATGELDHASLLAFTEDALGLPRLGAAADAPDLGAAFGI